MYVFYYIDETIQSYLVYYLVGSKKSRPKAEQILPKVQCVPLLLSVKSKTLGMESNLNVIKNSLAGHDE